MNSYLSVTYGLFALLSNFDSSLSETCMYLERVYIKDELGIKDQSNVHAMNQFQRVSFV